MSNTEVNEKPDYKQKKVVQQKNKVHDIRLHLNIAEHDLGIKLNQVKKFLAKHDQVRVTVQLLGREKSRPGSGLEFLTDIITKLEDYGTPANQPNLKNISNISVTLNPKKAK
jgi:translation initiation factor IF-3